MELNMFTVQYGWICPRCGRVNSPSIPFCSCSNTGTTDVSTNSTSNSSKYFINCRLRGETDYEYVKRCVESGISPRLDQIPTNPGYDKETYIEHLKSLIPLDPNNK